MESLVVLSEEDIRKNAELTSILKKDDGIITIRKARSKDVYEAQDPRYVLEQSQWDEVELMVKGCLTLAATTYQGSFSAHKSNLLINCPGNDTTYLMDAMMDKVAAQIGADLITIDLEDFGEMGAEFYGFGVPSNSREADDLQSLGYDSRKFILDSSPLAEEDEASEELSASSPEDAETDDFIDSERDSSGRSSSGLPGFPRGQLRDLLRRARIGNGPNDLNVLSLSLGESPDSSRAQVATPRHELINQILDSAARKRKQLSTSEETDESKPSLSSTAKPKLIIQIRDMNEMSLTRLGTKILQILTRNVQLRRRAGQNITVVGTSKSNLNGGIHKLMHNGESDLFASFHKIVVHPDPQFERHSSQRCDPEGEGAQYETFASNVTNKIAGRGYYRIGA